VLRGGVPEPDAEEDGKDAGVNPRGEEDFFREPDVVHDTEGGGDVDETVQTLPVDGPHPLDHAGGRGGGERQEQCEGRDTHGDVGTLHDISTHLAPREEVVEADPHPEVHRDVGEREQPEQSPQRHLPRHARHDPQRRQRQARQQQAQRPLAQRVRHEVDGIGGEIVRPEPVQQARQGQQARHPHGALHGDANRRPHVPPASSARAPSRTS
jgi:hypothetical protein